MPDSYGDLTGNSWLRNALHDLCQPLTTLECALYIGTMSPDGVRGPTAEELLRTIHEGLVQCERMTAQVRTIQARLAAEERSTSSAQAG